MLTYEQLEQLKEQPVVRRLRTIRSIMTQIDRMISDDKRPERVRMQPSHLRTRINDQFHKRVLTWQDHIDLLQYLDAVLTVLGKKENT